MPLPPTMKPTRPPRVPPMRRAVLSINGTPIGEVNSITYSPTKPPAEERDAIPHALPKSKEEPST
jgi:hypothetical protein